MNRVIISLVLVMLCSCGYASMHYGDVISNPQDENACLNLPHGVPMLTQDGKIHCVDF